MEPYEVSHMYSRRLHLIPATYPRQLGTTRDVGSRLDIAVHEYWLPNAEDAKFTLLLIHGTSFNKDFWKIIIDNLLQLEHIASHIKRILAMDAVNHGDSAVANRNKLGDQTFWPDTSYDILTTLGHFNVAKDVIGIGHSMGGGTLCHAAMIAPSIFTATIFVEPILFVMKADDRKVAQQAMRRREKWSSLLEVEEAFEKSSGLADWDPQQRTVYARTGTFGTDDGERLLKTPKQQEAATYLAAPYPKILDLLEKSSGQHYFVFGGRSKVISATQREQIAQRISDAGRTTVLPEASHLVPMTHPSELSRKLAQVLCEIIPAIAMGGHLSSKI